MLLRYPYCNISSLPQSIFAVRRQAIPHAADCDTGCPDWQNVFDICSDISFPFLLRKKCGLLCRAPEFYSQAV
jgi:hypothetical protein